MFKITMGKGVNIKFSNGWAVSIQWGPGNYCDNYSYNDFSPEGWTKAGGEGSSTAECAVFNPSGDFVDIMDWGDDVNGYMSPEDVLQLMQKVADQ